LNAIEIPTPHGPARAHIERADDARAALVLGHGAGGGVDTPDLAAAADAALSVGVCAALVEQPYRVAGKRSQPAEAKLDEAWTAVAEALRGGELEGLPLITGGRSAGARVACRTAAATGAEAVLCLAFPVHPPGKPEKSRLDELDAVGVPVLVVQGRSDQFGMPLDGPSRTVITVEGNHGLKKDTEAVAAAVGDWLPVITGATSSP
jgi:predicted alpha/beta-hydrolase family hydrolase